MREQLFVVIHEFNQGLKTIEQLKVALLLLIKKGLQQHLTVLEWKRFNRVFVGWVDMYDSKLQPRSGFLGRSLDILEQVFCSNYRISLRQVMEQTRNFENSMGNDVAGINKF